MLDMKTPTIRPPHCDIFIWLGEPVGQVSYTRQYSTEWGKEDETIVITTYSCSKKVGYHSSRGDFGWAEIAADKITLYRTISWSGRRYTTTIKLEAQP